MRLLLLLLVGCAADIDDDRDRDGAPDDVDCAPDDPAVFPGQVEDACDGLDTDCVEDPAEHDGDGDGYAECAGDCDDGARASHPGATEVCLDVYDRDCDGDPQNGCGRPFGALCGFVLNGFQGVGCLGHELNVDEPTCPAGYTLLDLAMDNAHAPQVDRMTTCVATDRPAVECTGSGDPTTACDPAATPQGLTCGLWSFAAPPVWEGVLGDGISCGRDLDLAARECPEGFGFYGFHNDGHFPGVGGVGVCVSRDATGAGFASGGGFVCDWSHTEEHTPDVSCPGGYHADPTPPGDVELGCDGGEQRRSSFQVCPPGCEGMVADWGAPCGEGWEICACSDPG